MTQQATATILIVENEPETLDVLIDALRERGLAVEVAGRGETALRTVEKFAPDLVLSVAQLADMTPEAFTEKLGETPVIFTSDNDDADEVVRLLGAGAADYILKPYYVEEVVARVMRRLPPSRAA